MTQQNEHLPTRSPYVRITPTKVLEDLLNMSTTLKMDLRLENVREYLGLEETTGVKSFELVVPELRFKALNYKGQPYVKITIKPEVLSVKLERRREDVAK